MRNNLEKVFSIINNQVYHTSTCVVDLIDSNNYPLAQDIYANCDYPMFSNTTKDGYCIQLEGDGASSYDVVGDVFAGMKSDIIVGNNQAVKITTGAKLPKNTNCVIKYEDVELCGEKIIIKNPKHLKANKNCILRASKIKKGQMILAKNSIVSPSDIELLSSLGIRTVKVHEKPVISILSIGDELVSCWQDNLASKIVNSNEFYLKSRLEELGLSVKNTMISKDNKESIRSSIMKLIGDDTQLVITCGGTGNSEKDLTYDILKSLGGQIIFNKIDIRPAGGTFFVKLGKVYILCLSGNPFAMKAGFEIIGKSILAQMSKNDKHGIKINSGFLDRNIILKNANRKLIDLAYYYKDGKCIITDELGYDSCYVDSNYELELSKGNLCRFYY